MLEAVLGLDSTHARSRQISLVSSLPLGCWPLSYISVQPRSMKRRGVVPDPFRLGWQAVFPLSLKMLPHC